MQYPKSKSNVFNKRSRKKCRSIIRKWFTALFPTVNSTLKIDDNNKCYLCRRQNINTGTYVAPTVFNLRNCGVN